MTREEATAILQSMIPTPCRADGKSTTHALVTIALGMAIKALEQTSALDKVREEGTPLPNEQDWIPVTERLPEADVDVLVTDNGGGVPTVIVDACGVKDNTGERFWYISQTPVAWMEWPVPYKAESEDKEV